VNGIHGKVALITGAAHGQGRSHAVRLAEEGAHVVAVDLRADLPLIPYAGGTREELDETVRLVQEAGREAIAVVGDVRDQAAMVAAVAAGEQRFGHVDIALANAGINLHGQPAHEIDEQAWHLMIDINLTGV